MRYFLASLVGLVCTGCVTTTTTSLNSGNSRVPSVESLVMQGAEVLTRDKFPLKAVEKFFNPAIARCEQVYGPSNTRSYVARSPAEMIYYLTVEAENNTGFDTTEVISSACPDAYYLKGYAMLDLGDPAAAERFVLKALEWSPKNAFFMLELGHIRQSQRDWTGSMEYFEDAREAAEVFSPEEFRIAEQTRAIRGIGYCLIELGDLDGAIAVFNESLQLDPDDEKARDELRYIDALRAGEV